MKLSIPTRFSLQTVIKIKPQDFHPAVLVAYAVLRESFSLSAIIAINSEFVGLPRCD